MTQTDIELGFNFQLILNLYIYLIINLLIFIFSVNKSESTEDSVNLIEGDFTKTTKETDETKVTDTKPSSALLDLNWSTSSGFLSGDFMPSKLIQNDLFKIVQENPNESNANATDVKQANESFRENQVSWLSLFAELDPLANNQLDDGAGNKA